MLKNYFYITKALMQPLGKFLKREMPKNNGASFFTKIYGSLMLYKVSAENSLRNVSNVYTFYEHYRNKS